MVILDITDKASPKMISHSDFSPPFSGIHIPVPFHGMKVPNFTKGKGDVAIFWPSAKKLWPSTARS